MTTVRRTMIVQAAIADRARSLASQFGPNASGMWTTPVRPIGSIGTATAYVSEGPIDSDFADMLSSADALVAGAAAKGVTIDLATAQGLLSQSTVVETVGSALSTIAALGYEMVPEGL